MRSMEMGWTPGKNEGELNRPPHLMKWTPQSKIKPGGPKMRWKDKIAKHAGTKCVEKADDKGAWSQMAEAYIQWWSNNG